MYRTIINQLISWKDSSNRKPLILTGVRQCGKTFVLQEFGKCYFEQVAYFNFEQSQTLSSIFDLGYIQQPQLDELQIQIDKIANKLSALKHSYSTLNVQR